ncbi:MAG: hypothetical protein CFE25_17170 [Chitinophagaceae bacterium BSSC1]|nr:MAG: hypothetical protein CFE25_17170 [Chitinophagaceae bacterium BSSC1]
MNPFIFDQALSISLQDLKRLHFFRSLNGFHESELRILIKDALNENEGVFYIKLCTNIQNPYLKIAFELNCKRITQIFEIRKIEGNPQKGYKWFIVCPSTGTYCTKLFLAKEGFRSRRDIKGSYKIQTIRFGHKREYYKKLMDLKRLKRTALKMEKPYSKPFYRGCMTVRNKKAIEAKWKLRQFTNP